MSVSDRDAAIAAEAVEEAGKITAPPTVFDVDNQAERWRRCTARYGLTHPLTRVCAVTLAAMAIRFVADVCDREDK